jgi:hypothetical protein
LVKADQDDSRSLEKENQAKDVKIAMGQAEIGESGNDLVEHKF